MDDSRRYPIGQQNFRELRENGSIYVDKTSFVEKIANNSSQYWFLARPLTIKNHDFRTDTVSLGVPNKEVKEALNFSSKTRRLDTPVIE